MYFVGWEPRFALYELPNSKLVAVGSRPTPENGPIDWENSCVDRFVSVSTKSPSWYPPEVKFHWAPFLECHPVKMEVLCVVFSVIRNFLESEEKFLYLHCDAGSNRAPVVFGLFLKVHFPEEIESIVKNRTMWNFEGDASKFHACPQEYARCEIATSKKKPTHLIEFLRWASEQQDLDLESFLADVHIKAWKENR